jgi:type I restriction enzyme M protein
METIIGTETEKEVEIRLIEPLFREILGYPAVELEWNRPVKITWGRESRTKQADLVVNHHKKPVIAVEAKRPTETVQSGLSQVDSYAFALSTPYSVITNGKHLVLRGYYSFNSKINVIDESVEGLAYSNWDKLINLVSFKNILSAIKEPENKVEAPDEEKIKDYRRFFRKIHNAIRDLDKLDPAAAFDELSKLLFLKAAEDEWQASKKSKSVLTPEKIAEWEAIAPGKGLALVNEWFQVAVKEFFPGVFDAHDRINLKSATIQDVLGMMKPFHVKNGDVDIKGRAFEEFLPSQLRGEGLGQYFTPRPVVNFMAEMAGISIHDTVVDFACGSGGFLIKAFAQMKGRVEQMPAGTLKRLGIDRSRMLEDIKANQIYGVDAEPRAARTAKMNMLMWGDGKRVVRGNALDEVDFNGEPFEPHEYRATDPASGCSLILANPPFGSKEKEKHILTRYVLGSKLQEKKSEKTELLFLEKGLNLLRPEGRMLIVIPQGILSGRKYAKVRDLIHSQAEIRAIVSLPTHAFVQSGVPTVNTCVLYVQKFTAEKKKLYDEKTSGMAEEKVRTFIKSDSDFDYQIFMGTSEFIGYEPSGRSIVGSNEETDLDLILKDFASQSELSFPDTDLFEYASRHYGEKTSLRRQQTIRGTTKGLKTSFVVPFSQTVDRLDPPFYFLKYQAGSLIESLENLGESISLEGKRFRPKTDDQLDAEYPILSVSSDGKLTLDKYLKGEHFTQVYKRVRSGDMVYNPARINIGSIGLVTPELDGCYVSPEYVVFRSKKLEPEFLVNLLRSPFYKMYIDVVTTGSIRDRLLSNELKTLRVPNVSPDKQVVACERSRRVDEEITELLKGIADEKAKTVKRLHELIMPVVPDISGPEETFESFAALADQWRRETGMYSSISKKLKHPAYQKIIGMGEKVVPYLLEELRERPDHWFEALKTITGQTPVNPSERTDMKLTAKAWLNWGKEQGLIK